MKLLPLLLLLLLLTGCALGGKPVTRIDKKMRCIDHFLQKEVEVTGVLEICKYLYRRRK